MRVERDERGRDRRPPQREVVRISGRAGKLVLPASSGQAGPPPRASLPLHGGPPALPEDLQLDQAGRGEEGVSL